MTEKSVVLFKLQPVLNDSDALLTLALLVGGSFHSLHTGIRLERLFDKVVHGKVIPTGRADDPYLVHSSSHSHCFSRDHEAIFGALIDPLPFYGTLKSEPLQLTIHVSKK